MSGPFESMVTPTTDEYRLEVFVDPDADTPRALTYFTAAGADAAVDQARRILAAVDGPDDRWGELYVHDGDGSALHFDTIHLPA